MVDFGEAKSVLGIRIDRDWERGTLKLSQEKYVKDVLVKFKMQECKGVTSPLVPGRKLSKEMEPQSPEEKAEMANVPYRSAVGSIMYLMVSTRPDLAAAIGVLSRFLTNPGKEHWDAVKRVLRYLKQTAGYALEFKKSESLELSGFCDSDWGGCEDSRRSTTGYVFLMGGAAVAWNSKRQSAVALSTCEAEYMAASQAAKEALWELNFLEELNVKVDLPISIFSDSSSALKLMKNPTFHSRTKHIDIQVHFIRELIESKVLDFQFCFTGDQVADCLTKGVPVAKMAYCIQEMGLSKFE
jgi:hypothetical protein